MKYYTATSTTKNGTGDEFDTYAGLDKEKAIDAAKRDWIHLTDREKRSTIIEVREYDLPDDIDINDEDELVNAMCDCCGYNPIIEFDYNFSKKLREQLDLSNLSQSEFSKKLGIPLRTFENWISGIRTPNKFTQDAALKKAEEIVEEIENEE